MTCLAPGGRPPEKEEPMSWTLDGPGGAAVMRAADAEAMSTGQVSAHLLLDSSATHEAVSVVRVTLAEGADGAVPHRHDKSSELFYVLFGSAAGRRGGPDRGGGRPGRGPARPAARVRRAVRLRRRAADHHHPRGGAV